MGPNSNPTTTPTNKYKTNFKEMPFLLKLLTVLTVYSLIVTMMDVIQNKSISLDYFGSGFPANYPFIWYLFYLALNAATLFVYFKRSFSLLKKYLIFAAVMLILDIANASYIINNVPAEMRAAPIIIYTLTYIIGVLLMIYQYQQKKYFNQS